MAWKTIRDIAWFIFIFGLAITLIENKGSNWIVEMAGDIFGAMGLMFLAAERALRDED